MDLTELKNSICDSFSGSLQELEEILAFVEEDEAIFPFNDYEHLICGLIDNGGLTYTQYVEIRTEYINSNPNLWIFEISAPRGFGEKFAQTYVMGKSSELKKASKKLDPNFSNEYDLWLDNIRIEVKASRAVNSDSDAPLYVKALSRSTDKPFLMNFQQLKPQCCDVFIWVAVFRDDIVLWIMSSSEVANHPMFSKGQHRGNKGNEGQLHIKNGNIHVMNEYELTSDDIARVIRDAAARG